MKKGQNKQKNICKNEVVSGSKKYISGKRRRGLMFSRFYRRASFGNSDKEGRHHV